MVDADDHPRHPKNWSKMHKEIKTYRDLKEFLAKLSDKELDQVVQVTEPSPLEMTVLCPALAIGTVKDFGFSKCRNAIHNTYNGKDIVILTDNNPFGEHGETAYEIILDGNKKGKDIFSNTKPIYGKNGKTPVSKQTAPKFSGKKRMSKELFYVLKNRLGVIRRQDGIEEMIKGNPPV